MANYTITRSKFLSFSETFHLLETCKGLAVEDVRKGRKTWPVRYMLVHLALRTGLRVSEIAALKLSDINLLHNESYLVVRKGKRGRRRDVYFDSSLRKHLETYLEWRKTSGFSTHYESPLLPGRAGKTYTTTALHLSFKRAIEKACLPALSIHGARHTYATQLLAKTSNLRFVQKQLGHASLSMTSLYADVLPEFNQFFAESMTQ